MEELREVRAQQMDKKCPKCNQGYMRPNGIVNMGPTPYYDHVCNSCGHTDRYTMRYPYYI